MSFKPTTSILRLSPTDILRQLSVRTRKLIAALLLTAEIEGKHERSTKWEWINNLRHAPTIDYCACTERMT